MHTSVHLTESTATEFFLYDIFIIESLAWDTTTLSGEGLGMIRNSRVDGILEVVIGPTDIEPIVTKIDELITTSPNLFEEYEQELNSPTKTRH